jgi:hypothetical protein
MHFLVFLPNVIVGPKFGMSFKRTSIFARLVHRELSFAMGKSWPRKFMNDHDEGSFCGRSYERNLRKLPVAVVQKGLALCTMSYVGF